MSNRLPPSWSPGRTPAAIVFDCDGVLIESVDIKTEAFTELFAEYPQHHAAIVDHHQTHLGISRFEKFEWIYRELLGRELTDDESVALGSKFSEPVFDRTGRCPEVGSIAEACSVTPSSLVFVGDGWSDYQAALGTGATFILRETVAQADRFSDFRGARGPNLVGLQELLHDLRMQSSDE